MMHHPFFDPSTYSDKELDDKINETVQRMNTAYNINANSFLIDQLQSIYDMLIAEQQERIYKKEKDNNKKRGKDKEKDYVSDRGTSAERERIKRLKELGFIDDDDEM